MSAIAGFPLLFLWRSHHGCVGSNGSLETQNPSKKLLKKSSTESLLWEEVWRSNSFNSFFLCLVPFLSNFNSKHTHTSRERPKSSSFCNTDTQFSTTSGLQSFYIIFSSYTLILCPCSNIYSLKIIKQLTGCFPCFSSIQSVL